MGDERLGRFLEVVGRQAVVLGTDEGLEVPPGLARDVEQQGAILSASSTRALEPAG